MIKWKTYINAIQYVFLFVCDLFFSFLDFKKNSLNFFTNVINVYDLISGFLNTFFFVFKQYYNIRFFSLKK